MSKYTQLGPYHFVEYTDPETAYAKHVDDLLKVLAKVVGEPGARRVIEVGCGEGLILNQIYQRLRWVVQGTDVDPEAVRLGNRLCPVARIEKRGLTHRVFDATTWDVVMFLDSLEHIDLWQEHLIWAKGAQFVVVAVPSQHDRHGLRDFKTEQLKEFFVGWECVHEATRHARHLLIWKRPT